MTVYATETDLLRLRAGTMVMNTYTTSLISWLRHSISLWKSDYVANLSLRKDAGESTFTSTCIYGF